MLALVLATLGALASAGCVSPSSADARIHLDNLTDVSVGTYVNGEWAGTSAAGTSAEAPLGGHGGPAYTIEIRSLSNVVLMTLRVNEAQAGSIGVRGRGVAGEVGVPCGILRVVVGTLEDGAVPAPAESVAPGPCP